VQETFVEPEQEAEGALASFSEDKRWYTVWPVEPAPVGVKSAPRSGFRLIVGLASHPGQVRELDEDSVLALTFQTLFEGRLAPSLGFYAIADGLGGHEAGEVASQMAVRLVADQVARRVLVPEVAGEICLAETAIELLIEAVNEVNGQIYLARQRAGNETRPWFCVTRQLWSMWAIAGHIFGRPAS
jgi:hypothetical protein